jgi:hypothetical protein
VEEVVKVCFFLRLKTTTAPMAIRITANAEEANRTRFASGDKPVDGDDEGAGVGVGGGNDGSVLTT